MAFLKKTQQPNAPAMPENAAAVLAALQAPTIEVRRQAARAASQYPECGAPLCALLETEADAGVRAHMLTALTKMQTAAIAKALSVYLRSEDVSLRNDVIVALQQMPEALAPYMHDLLHDSDRDVRIFALTILAHQPSAAARDWLLEVIAHEPDITICATALEALAELSTPDIIPALHTLASRFDSDFMRFAVNAAIQRIQA